MFQFEEPDAVLSPQSGLTRTHWVALAETLAEGVLEAIPSVGAAPRFPGAPSAYGESSDRLEAISRSALLCSVVAPALPKQLQDTLQGSLARALEHAFRGGEVPSLAHHGQQHVEAGALALAFSLPGEPIWNLLDTSTRGQLVRWMSDILRFPSYRNNWVFFPAFVAHFLESNGHGGPKARKAIRRAAVIGGKRYLGEGWYSDGPGAVLDYYNSFAWHFYLPLLASLRDDQYLVSVTRGRLAEYLHSLDRLVDESGAPVFFGRSLTYRFGVAAPYGMAAWLGGVREGGELRARASRVVAYFVNHGAVVDKQLSVGWHGPSQAVGQHYTSPASPLWAAKTLLPLRLDTNHEFWSHKEPNLVAKTSPHFVGLNSPSPMMLMGGPVATLTTPGLTRVAPWRRDPAAPESLYAGNQYTSATAPGLDPEQPTATLEVVSSSGLRVATRVRAVGASESALHYSTDTAEPLRLQHSARLGLADRWPLVGRQRRQAKRGARVEACLARIDDWTLYHYQVFNGHDQSTASFTTHAVDTGRNSPQCEAYFLSSRVSTILDYLDISAINGPGTRRAARLTLNLSPNESATFSVLMRVGREPFEAARQQNPAVEASSAALVVTAPSGTVQSIRLVPSVFTRRGRTTHVGTVARWLPNGVNRSLGPSRKLDTD